MNIDTKIESSDYRALDFIVVITEYCSILF